MLIYFRDTKLQSIFISCNTLPMDIYYNSEVRHIDYKILMRKELTKIKPCEHPCPFRTVMDRLGDKWSVPIIMILQEEGTLRFGELLNHIDGISLKMLSSCLKKLEMEKLIKRTVYPEVPPKVEYSLTPTGRGLTPHIQQLSEWAHKNLK